MSVRFALLAGLLTAAGSSFAADDRDDASAFEQLDLAFGTTGPAVPAVGEGRARAYRQFVRDRLTQDAFYDTVLPRLFSVFSENSSVNGTVPFVLKKGKVGSRDVYFINNPTLNRAGPPCTKPEELVSTHPWWDENETAWLCSSDFHPETRVDPHGDGRVFCEGRIVNHEINFKQKAGCGCGERLLNCARDRAQLDQLEGAYVDEVVRTMQQVIQSRARFSGVLTMTSTVRSDLAELFYARNRYFKTGRFELGAIGNGKPSLKPRDPEFAGGVLTTPLFLYWEFSRRLTTQKIWEDFLCAPLASTGVRAADMFHLGDARLRTRGHLALTQMTGCSDCHARIENGVQAFSAFPPATNGFRHVAEWTFAGTAKFYVRDATDARAEGPSTPLWVGQTVARQPEFISCMTRKVEELIYRGFAVPPQLHQQLLSRFARDEDLAAAIEDAVVARYVGIESQSPASEAKR